MLRVPVAAILLAGLFSSHALSAPTLQQPPKTQPKMPPQRLLAPRRRRRPRNSANGKTGTTQCCARQFPGKGASKPPIRVSSVREVRARRAAAQEGTLQRGLYQRRLRGGPGAAPDERHQLGDGFFSRS